MTALRKNTAIFALLGIAVLFATPAIASASSSGGFGYADPGLPATDGSQLQAPVGTMVGKPAKFSGHLGGIAGGTTVEIQRSDAAGNWTAITTTTADSAGNFSVSWTPIVSERLTLRAVPSGATIRAASTIPTRGFSVYTASNATWFGPGFYGNKTGCGKRMSAKLLGVANKTLKCGTKVEVFYKGRSVTVPVVDRGPFRKNTDYDLTAATAKKLKFKQTAQIGALVSPTATK